MWGPERKSSCPSPSGLSGCTRLDSGARSVVVSSITPKQSHAHHAAGRSICVISDTSFGPHRCLPIKSPSIYHMVKWEALAAPKDFGGLGFVDTRAMNTVAS